MFFSLAKTPTPGKRIFAQTVRAVKLMPDLNEYMTTDEAAKKLHFNVQSIRHMIRQGTLKGRKIGRLILVEKQAIEDYQNKTKGMSKNDPRRNQIAQ
jgi:excisionase family DNA binding protein